jgi:hypothetical protein
MIDKVFIEWYDIAKRGYDSMAFPAFEVELSWEAQVYITSFQVHLQAFGPDGPISGTCRTMDVLANLSKFTWSISDIVFTRSSHNKPYHFVFEVKLDSTLVAKSESDSFVISCRRTRNRVVKSQLTEYTDPQTMLSMIHGIGEYFSRRFAMADIFTVEDLATTSIKPAILHQYMMAPERQALEQIVSNVVSRNIKGPEATSLIRELVDSLDVSTQNPEMSINRLRLTSKKIAELIQAAKAAVARHQDSESTDTD